MAERGHVGIACTIVLNRVERVVRLRLADATASANDAVSLPAAIVRLSPPDRSKFGADHGSLSHAVTTANGAPRTESVRGRATWHWSPICDGLRSSGRNDRRVADDGAWSHRSARLYFAKQ